MKFRQLVNGTPPDIEATMTYSEAEKFKNDLQECDVEESPSYDSVNIALMDEAAEVTFVIPGSEAGENGDLIEELADYLENINDEVINKAESA